MDKSELLPSLIVTSSDWVRIISSEAYPRQKSEITVHMKLTDTNSYINYLHGDLQMEIHALHASLTGSPHSRMGHKNRYRQVAARKRKYCNSVCLCF